MRRPTWLWLLTLALVLVACTRATPPADPRPIDPDAVGRALVASAELVPVVIDPAAGAAECIAAAAVRSSLVAAGEGIAAEAAPTVRVDYTACLALLDSDAPDAPSAAQLDRWVSATAATVQLAVVSAELAGAPPCHVARARLVLTTLQRTIREVLDEATAEGRDGIFEVVPAAGDWPVCP